MNVKRYNQILDHALNKFWQDGPPNGPYEELVGRFDVETLRLALGVAETGVHKLAASKSTVSYLLEMLHRALDVLWACCDRPRWKTQDERIQVVRKFEAALAQARHNITAKNSDYSPHNIYKGASLGLSVRNGDKSSRISNAVHKKRHVLKVKDEKLVDTAGDMVNYCVYQVMVAEDAWVTPAERAKFREYLKRYGGEDLLPYFEEAGARQVNYRPPQDRSAPWSSGK